MKSDLSYVPVKLRTEFREHLKWYEDNLLVFDKQTAEIIPLRLNAIQTRLEWIKYDAMRHKRPLFLLVLKCRQPGVSTWAQATCFRDGLMMENRRTLIIAYDDVSTREMLDRTKFFHSSFVEKCYACGGSGETDKGKVCPTCEGSQVCPRQTDKDSAAALKFQKNKSEFRVHTAGSREKTARGFYASAVHFSEIAYFEEAKRTYISAMQVISDKFPTVVINEFTAQGPQNFAQELWLGAQEGLNDYTTAFFPWFEFEHYQRPISWEDVGRWSSKEWKERNQALLEAVGVYALKAQGGQDVEHGSAERKRAVEVSGGGEGGGGGARPADQRSEGEPKEAHGLRDRGALAEAGAPSGGRAASVPSGFERPSAADLRKGIHVGPSRFQRALRETGRDPGLWRQRPGDGLGGAAGSLRPELLRSPLNALSDSLTPYEQGLVEEFDLRLEQINWLRYCLNHLCHGDETERRRDYPSRPEEAFEASGADILNPYVIAKWEKEAKENPGERGRFEMKEKALMEFVPVWHKDDQGYVTIWEKPKKKGAYVQFLDPSEGFADSDWQVCSVMDLDTGNQVAEYRGRLDPDIAVDQVEGLGLFYNGAFTAVEVQGGGRAFQRHLARRGTLPLYEREGHDKVGGIDHPVKKGGWWTDETLRKEMFSELRAAVREERCQIRSPATLAECRTLWEKKIGEHKGKIEARPGYHDDGVISWAGAIMLYNRFMRSAAPREEEARKGNPIVAGLLERNAIREKRAGQIKVRLPTKTVTVSPAVAMHRGRRSVL